MSRLRWCSVLICFSFLTLACHGKYTLKIKAVQYHNPDNEDWDGGCCDPIPFSCGTCDLYFIFCIRNKGLSPSNTHNCWDSVRTQSDITTGNYWFPSSGELYPGARVWNDITFNRDEAWPGSVQVLVENLDADNNADDLIDRNAFNIDLSPNGQWTQELYANGHYDRAQFRIRAQLLCQENYYASDCTVYCVAQNDNTNGHYTCGSNGEKVCNTGYTNPSGNCLTPICSSGCSAQNGYCNVPGECLCNSGWTGNNCNECIPKSGCSTSHGYCNQPNECLCESGYGGSLCTEDHDVCGHQAPCLRGGTCTNVIPNSFRCSCPSGYNGTRCETEINECDPKPCHNGGTCFDRVNGYLCECPPGWTGSQCQTNIDDCQSSPCQNNGTCKDLVNDYQCSCVAGFIGPNCEGHHCDSNPCSNNGTCAQVTMNGIGYVCACQPGYTGVNCTEEIDECSPNPCQNGATCIDALADYSCTCVAGFTGKNCQINIDECIGALCSGHSICMDKVNNYTCICDTGYTGRYCEIEIDYCSPPPCLNNGSCNSYPGYYTCNCQEGFNGTECENNIDDCVPNPCLNGGTCNDIVRGFTCSCRIGWTGLICNTTVSACDPNPCPEQYTCVDNTSSINGYSYYCEHCSEYDNCIINGVSNPSPTAGSVTGDGNGGWGMFVGVSVGGALLSCCLVTFIICCCCYLCRKRQKEKIFVVPTEGSHFSDNPTYIPPELLQSTTLDRSASLQYGSALEKQTHKRRSKKERPQSPTKDGYELLAQSGDSVSSLGSTIRSGGTLLSGVYDKLKRPVSENIYTDNETPDVTIENPYKAEFDEESFPPLKGKDTISPYDSLGQDGHSPPTIYDRISPPNPQPSTNPYDRIPSPTCTSPVLNTPYEDASLYATIPADNSNIYESLPSETNNDK